jgi:NADH-quinone oxidoreductase subunit M
MISAFPILSLMTALPMAGVILLLFLRGTETQIAQFSKITALFITIIGFFLSVFLLAKFDPSVQGYQFVEKYKWFALEGMSFRLGVDGISVFFVVLTNFLMPVALLAGWKSITKNVRHYMALFLLLNMFMIGTFCALDAILFYVFFEAVLIPMFLLIGIWGGANRVYASYKFFLYTLLGSVLMLVALIYMINKAGSADIEMLTQFVPTISPAVQYWLWLGLFASFAVKMPMWPVHTWLPNAHVEAPTAGSIILAGVLLKMGGYGFLRFSLPMLPDASLFFAPFVMGLSVIAIIYASLVAYVQTDMKKMIAYSSVAHMGFVTLGIFALNEQGVQGAIFQMISHGLISGALFLAVGVVYDRLHTRDIARYGGIVKNMPRYATFFMILTLASVGLPVTSGFVGEFLSLLGAFLANPIMAVFATTGVIFGAIYMLLLYRRVIFGKAENEDAAAMKDLDLREYMLFLPIAILIFILGVYPSLITKRTEGAVKAILNADATTQHFPALAMEGK